MRNLELRLIAQWGGVTVKAILKATNYPVPVNVFQFTKGDKQESLHTQPLLMVPVKRSI